MKLTPNQRFGTPLVDVRSQATVIVVLQTCREGRCAGGSLRQNCITLCTSCLGEFRRIWSGFACATHAFPVRHDRRAGRRRTARNLLGQLWLALWGRCGTRNGGGM